jgi:hypothetical protein
MCAAPLGEPVQALTIATATERPLGEHRGGALRRSE